MCDFPHTFFFAENVFGIFISFWSASNCHGVTPRWKLNNNLNKNNNINKAWNINFFWHIMLNALPCQGQDLKMSYSLSFQLDALSLNYLLTLYLKLLRISVRCVQEKKEQGLPLENLSIIKDVLSTGVSSGKSSVFLLVTKVVYHWNNIKKYFKYLLKKQLCWRKVFHFLILQMIMCSYHALTIVNYKFSRNFAKLVYSEL